MNKYEKRATFLLKLTVTVVANKQITLPAIQLNVT